MLKIIITLILLGFNFYILWFSIEKYYCRVIVFMEVTKLF